MRWWPRKARARAPDPAILLSAPTEAPSASPDTPDSPPTPPPEPPFVRPKTLIELLSDASLNLSQAKVLLMIVGGLMVIGTACAVLVLDALKGIKISDSTLRSALPYGMGLGASLVAYLSNRVWRRIRRKLGEPTKADRADSPDS